MTRLTKNRMPQVALLLETSHGVSRAMLQGVFNYVRVYGPWSLNVIEGGSSDQRLPDTRVWKGDGIIARVPNDEAAKAILASRLPAVLVNPADAYLDPRHPLSRYSRIQFDSHAIGAFAAAHLLGRTPRHFAFVGAASDPNWSRWRREAFCARIAQADAVCHDYPLPPAPERDWSAERPRLCAWLKKLPKPAAIFAANDNRGRQVLDACLVADIGVPYEVTVLGVNNDPLICETSIPPLSSIAVDDEKAGYEAAQVLDLLMQGREGPGRVVRYGPKDLISRTSTADLQIADKRVIRALEFIRINAGITVKVDDLVRHLHASRRSLETRFKAAMGRTVYAEIMRVRLERVQTLLRETPMTIEAIADTCGFASASHLGTVFRSHFGKTLSSFRRQTRADER